MAWSPAGSVLATVSSADRAVVLWDVSDPRRPREQHRLGNGDVAALGIRSATFSPDGRVVAVSDYPATGWLTLVDVARGRELRQVAKGGQVGAPLVYSPDGKTIATVRYTEGTLLLLDAATGRTRVTRDVADSPGGWGFVHGGRHIAILSVPGSQSSLGPTALELWDATTLEPIGTRMTIARSRGWLAGANPDGTKLVIADHRRRRPLGPESPALGDPRLPHRGTQPDAGRMEPIPARPRLPPHLSDLTYRREPLRNANVGAGVGATRCRRARARSRR